MLTVISCCIVLIGFLIRRTRRRNTRNGVKLTDWSNAGHCGSVIFYFILFLYIDSTGNQERRSNSQENFAVVQLSLVISLFLVGYLPDTCEHTILYRTFIFIPGINLKDEVSLIDYRLSLDNRQLQGSRKKFESSPQVDTAEFDVYLPQSIWMLESHLLQSSFKVLYAEEHILL